MKKLFFSLVAMMLATVGFAQSTLVATLSHEGNISMYYGAFALRDALAAADNGDVINLSAGSFEAGTISKAVTIRGVGINAERPTYIVSNFEISISSDVIERLFLEGVRATGSITVKGTLSNAYFYKSEFYNFTGSSANWKQTSFVGCKITNGFILYGTSNVNFINCYVYGFDSTHSEQAGALFVNCILNSYSYTYKYEMSTLDNCIIYDNYMGTDANLKLPSTAYPTNCIGIAFSNPFDNTLSASNCTYLYKSSVSTIFKTFTGDYSDSETFELTDNAKTTYLGTDGTEVGMYGGIAPYSSIPSYPRISKLNVATKATQDGVLNVEIEVSNPE